MMLEETKKKFRAVMSALKGEESDLKSKLESALQRREKLEILPLPLDDQIDQVMLMFEDTANMNTPSASGYGLIILNRIRLKHLVLINSIP